MFINNIYPTSIPRGNKELAGLTVTLLGDEVCDPSSNPALVFWGGVKTYLFSTRVDNHRTLLGGRWS